jgi:hypothetical protein
MTSDEAVESVIDALEQSGIPYMIVGSFASNYYGIARSTKDADLLISLGEHSIEELCSRLNPELRFDPQMAFEPATFASKNVIHLQGKPFEIELFHLTDDPHNVKQFQRRRRVKYGNWDTWIPTAEDVIIIKLRWALQLKRRKDEDDVRDVIAVQQSNVDWSYVESWCDKHGTRQLLDEIRQSVAGI